MVRKDLSFAVESVLAVLGPGATPQEVREAVLRDHPELGEVSNRAWGQTIGQQLRILAKKPGSNGAPVIQHNATATELYGMADKLWTLCGGDMKLADEILGFLSKVSVDELKRGFRAMSGLVLKLGGIEKAREAINIMKDSGLIE